MVNHFCTQAVMDAVGRASVLHSPFFVPSCVCPFKHSYKDKMKVKQGHNERAMLELSWWTVGNQAVADGWLGSPAVEWNPESLSNCCNQDTAMLAARLLM